MQADAPPTCRGSYDEKTGRGCRCVEHYSLREYMLRLTGKDYGLQRAPGNQPRPPIVREVDDSPHSMTCTCGRCLTERAERVNAGPRPIRQPWDVA